MKKILIIDDKKDNLISFTALLKNYMPECKTITAQSGAEGIEAAKQKQPDTILLDIIMPKMDGYQVCKKLKADEKTKHIPILMLTAIKTDAESRIKGLKIGADAFLSKPVEYTELVAQINVMLRIKATEDKLRAEKDSLEERVNKRTKELSQSNEKLQLEISDRKKAEEKIKASLKEKEVLLQEIHHRVKNNMQIIVSLLRLQSNYAKDKKIEDMLKIARTRIHSMAAIHERLYRSKDFANINFALYIQGLTTHLMQTYQIDPKQITLKTDVKDINLDINKGVPVGLLLNELVSNALKHAFPKGKKGEILVKFYDGKKGQKTLIVSDNGIGHPDKVNISKPETLGMQLIKDLTTQIEGKLDLDNKAGTTFKITFA